MPKLQAALTGIATSLGVALYSAFMAKCPGLIEDLPLIIATGIATGIAKFAHSGRSQA